MDSEQNQIQGTARKTWFRNEAEGMSEKIFC